jgi:hypothetical protein
MPEKINVINYELRNLIQKYVYVTLILDDHVPYVFTTGIICILNIPLKHKYVLQTQ